MGVDPRLALVLAVYGAAVSTILATVQIARWVQDLRKEHRSIRVFLEYHGWVGRAGIVIVNSGHRPVTITEVGLSLVFRGEDGTIGGELVPRNALFEIEKEPFPTTLKDGDTLEIPLSEVVSRSVWPHMRVNLAVFDSEGNSYTHYEARLYDSKWGSYQTMKIGKIPALEEALGQRR